MRDAYMLDINCATCSMNERGEECIDCPVGKTQKEGNYEDENDNSL